MIGGENMQKLLKSAKIWQKLAETVQSGNNDLGEGNKSTETV